MESCGNYDVISIEINKMQKNMDTATSIGNDLMEAKNDIDSTTISTIARRVNRLCEKYEHKNTK